MKTVNITLEINDDDITNFENYLNNTFNLINFRIIPDTKELYEKDDVFKKLVKAEKQARRIKETYINENN